MSKILLIAVAVLPAFFSCRNDTLVFEQPKMIEFDKEKFYSERLAWERLNVTSYKFVQDLNYNAPRPVIKITVTNGKRTNFEIIEDRAISYGVIIFAGNIDELFDVIEAEFEFDCKEINDESGELKDLRVTVTYDEQYHFPKSVSYERFYRVTEFPGYSRSYDLDVTDFIETE